MKPWLVCHITVNMKMFPQNPFSYAAIIRRIAILVAVLVWGGMAFGDNPEKAISGVLPTNPSGTSANAVLREPFTDRTEISLDTTFGGLAIQPDGKIIAGTGMWG